MVHDDVRDGLVAELAGVVVPKIESVAGLDAVSSALDAAGFAELGVLAGLETALGVADARALLAHPRVIAGYFGAEDFIADMGGVRTPSNAEVATARSLVALAARLAGVPVLDQIVADFRDDDRFRHEAADARSLGYAGKLCIHPGQVGTRERGVRRRPARRSTGHGDSSPPTRRPRPRAWLPSTSRARWCDEPLAAQARRIIILARSM